MSQSEGKSRETLSARSRIYRFLYESKDFCSKQVLAGSCGVSMPTLYQNLGELLEDGLVRYTGEDQFTGGRRAQGLDIVPEARVSIGVSVTEHHMRLTAADPRLRDLAYRSVPVDLLLHLPYDAAAFARIVEDFIDEFSLDRKRILGVGVTIPGLLTADHTKVLVAPTLNQRDILPGVHIDIYRIPCRHRTCDIASVFRKYGRLQRRQRNAYNHRVEHAVVRRFIKTILRNGQRNDLRLRHRHRYMVICAHPVLRVHAVFSRRQ